MIIGRVGLIGNGKTYRATQDALTTAGRRGALFASNIWVRGSLPFAQWQADPTLTRRIQLSVGEDGFDLDELTAIIEYAHGEGSGTVLLLDEIGILMPARFWQSFPVDLMMRISQSRKLRVDVYWTSQDVEDVDSYLRRKTEIVYKTRAWPTPTILRQEQGKRPLFFYESGWAPTQVGKRDRRRSRGIRLYDRRFEGEYDTDELVMPAKRLAIKDLCARHRKIANEADCPHCLAESGSQDPRDLQWAPTPARDRLSA